MSRRVLLIALAAAFAVAGIWYVALWSPAQRDLGDAHKRTATAEQQSADLGIKVRALTAARKDMPAKQAQLDQLRAAVPDAPKLDEMIATVNNAALASGVDLGALAPSPPPGSGPGSTTAPGTPKAPGAPNEMNLTIQVTGTYFQVADFVNRLNASPRLVLIDSVNLAGGGDKTGKVTTALTAKMFVNPQVPGAAAGTGGN